MSGRNLIIAIDGPSGAGKSTVTKLLADRLGYVFLDTGAMYRSMALAVKRSGTQLDDEEQLAELCRATSISFQRFDGCCQVLMNGEDVSETIRTPEISLLTSRVSAKKTVRERMVNLQREMSRQGGVVLEGRDIGTVVFPDADVKFFLSASPEARGKRRYLELLAKGQVVDLEQTIAEVRQRDEQDLGRELAPLRMADDAVEIDSTGLSIDQVVEKMMEIIKARR